MADLGGCRRFVNDDGGYLAWLRENPEGFVVNSQRLSTSGYLVLHRASCKQINTPNRANWTTTGYIKTCSKDVASLADWARRETGGDLMQCGICKPGSAAKPKAPSAPQQHGKPERTRSLADSAAEACPRKSILTRISAICGAIGVPLIILLIEYKSGFFIERHPTPDAGKPATSGVIDESGRSNHAHEESPEGSGVVNTASPLLSRAASGAESLSTSLEDLLRGLPDLLVAEVRSKPSYDTKTSELVIQVAVGVDREKYEIVRAGLVQALEKVARRTGTTLLRAKPAEFNGKPQKRLLFNHDHPDLAGPGSELRKDEWCVWVANFSDEGRTTSRWSYFVLDLDLENVCESISSPTERSDGQISRSPSQGRTTVSISARTKDGLSVTEDEVELLASRELQGISTYPNCDDSRMPFLRNGLSFSDGRKYFFVAPCSFMVKLFPGYTPTWGLYYQAETVVKRRIKMSAEEAARITDISCKVSFQPGLSTEG